MIALFGPAESLFFHLAAMPTLVRSRLAELGGLTSALLQICSIAWLPVAFTIVIAIIAWRTADRLPLLSWLPKQRWIAYIILAFFMVPAVAAGFLKIGGADNTLVPALLPLLLAAALGCRTIFAHQTHSSYAKMLHVAGLALIVTVACIQTPRAVQDLISLRSLSQTRADRVTAYTNKNPGKAYFPFHTVAQLLGEKKLYHNENALIEMHYGRIMIDRSHLLEHLPADLQEIIIVPGDLVTEKPFIIRYLPQYSTVAPGKDDPTWTHYLPASAKVSSKPPQ